VFRERTSGPVAAEGKKGGRKEAGGGAADEQTRGASQAKPRGKKLQAALVRQAQEATDAPFTYEAVGVAGSSWSGSPPQFADLYRESKRRADPGYEVPYKFKITEDPGAPGSARSVTNRLDTHRPLTYTDFAGNRFPTLDTDENYRYWKDTGLDRLLPRVFPLQLPTHRRLDPFLREYIFFLHTLDPRRFSMAKIGERYGLKEETVEKVYEEFSTRHWMVSSGLAPHFMQRISRAEAAMRAKEDMFFKRLGWDQVGNEEIEEEESEEWKGFKGSIDWLKRQNVEVEMMSAFPKSSKLDPIPKRVDVDVTVKQEGRRKVINWIDPQDKVVF